MGQYDDSHTGRDGYEDYRKVKHDSHTGCNRNESEQTYAHLIYFGIGFSLSPWHGTA